MDIDGHGELWDKFRAIFFAKVDVGVGVKAEVGLGMHLTIGLHNSIKKGVILAPKGNPTGIALVGIFVRDC